MGDASDFPFDYHVMILFSNEISFISFQIRFNDRIHHVSKFSHPVEKEFSSFMQRVP